MKRKKQNYKFKRGKLGEKLRKIRRGFKENVSNDS